MDHYVLLPHQGRLKGRTMIDVEGSSAQFGTIIYSTGAGESLRHLMKWTGLDRIKFKRAPIDMNTDSEIREMTSMSKKFPQNTWIEIETYTIPKGYKLLGSWHRYDKVRGLWDPVYGPPRSQAKQQEIVDDTYEVDCILACRKGRFSDSIPTQLQYAIRWKGYHVQQHAVIPWSELFSSRRDTFITNQAIDLGGDYHVSREIFTERPCEPIGLEQIDQQAKRIADGIYLGRLAKEEGWPRNVKEYLETRNTYQIDEWTKWCTRNDHQNEYESFLGATHTVSYSEEWELWDEMTTVATTHVDPVDSSSKGIDSEEHNSADINVNVFSAQTEVNRVIDIKGAREQGKKWSDSVHEFNGVPWSFEPLAYFEFMRDLYHQESRYVAHSSKLTVKGQVRSALHLRIKQGICISFHSEQVANMKGIHEDKEVMITMQGDNPAKVRGVIIQLVRKPKAFVMIHIKPKYENDMSAVFQVGGSLEGELELVERDTFAQQLEGLLSNHAGKYTRPEIAHHILNSTGKKYLSSVKDLPSHSEANVSSRDYLNNSQDAVVTWASSLSGLGLLFGPPGTGKTHTSATIIKEWAQLNKGCSAQGTIFVVATSNTAVDGLMAKYLDLTKNDGEDIRVGRLCSRTHSESIRKTKALEKYDIMIQAANGCRRHSQDEKEPTGVDLEASDEDMRLLLGYSQMDPQTKNWIRNRMIQITRQLHIVFTTVNLAGATIFKDVQVLQVLMEEAGATPEFATLPIIAKSSSTVLLVGDHQQLPPVIQCPNVQTILYQSLFERLWYTPVPKRQLQLQYRLPRSVIQFFNESVYNEDHCLNPIEADIHHEDSVLPEALLIKNPIVIINSASTGLAGRNGEGEETHEIGRGYYNITEAVTIVNVLSNLTQQVLGILASEVGICAPYKLQVAHIRKFVQAQTWPKGFDSDQILIATADAFQGSERKYMFVSIVRTSTHSLTFAISLKRINVVLSRSSTASFVFVNVNVFGRTIQPKKARKDVLEGLSMLWKLIDWQKQIDNVYDLKTWHEMFKTPVTQTLLIQCDKEEMRIKERWERLYYVTLRRRVLIHVHPKIMSEPITRIDSEWWRFKRMFRVASVRQLLSNKMAVCTNYWLFNIIGSIGGANPPRTVRQDNTVLTVQNSEQPTVGWPHESKAKYPRLLLTLVMGLPAKEGTVYEREVEMAGIRMGQWESSKKGLVLEPQKTHEIDEGDVKKEVAWLHVSRRSQRAMRAIFDLLRQEYKIDKEIKVNNHLMIAIRQEPLRRQWEKVNYITHFKKGFSLNHKERAMLRWHIIAYQRLYLYPWEKEIKNGSNVLNLSIWLGWIMAYQHLQRTQLQYRYLPYVTSEKIKGKSYDEDYKRGWWRGIHRKIKYSGQAATSWTQQLIRYPWYRWMPLLSLLSSLKVGVRYLPSGHCSEDSGAWHNPEAVTVDQKEGMVTNDDLWKSWGDECSESLRIKQIAFYTNEEIEVWWVTLEETHKREALKWMLYDRLDYRWHCTSGLWMHYLGKIPGRIQPIPPYTILHSRERRIHQVPEKWDRLEVVESLDEIQHGTSIISDQRWKHYLQVKALQTRHGNNLYKPPMGKSLGGNSIVPDVWNSASKEEALHVQRQHCERLAHHQMGKWVLRKMGSHRDRLTFIYIH